MSFHFFHRKFTKREKRDIDTAMMVVATIHPFTAIPQAVEIYANQSAANVSLVTWLSFMLIGVVFSMYAVIHRIKPMIVNQILWYIVDFVIVIGILIYG